MADDDPTIEAPKATDNWGRLLARLTVYGLLAFVFFVATYLVLQVDWQIAVSITAEPNLSGPLTLLAWAVGAFIVMILIGSYARVFGVGFLSSIGDVALDLMDMYRRKR